jgi:membrane-anchored protein YejM (alkaline phosphatase superfamily)
VTDKTNSVFAFFHYSVPHLPFIYERDQYSPAHKPLLENKINYKRQLQYVDKLFGELIAVLKKTGKFKSSKIIVLSDPGYRKYLKVEKKQCAFVIL